LFALHFREAVVVGWLRERERERESNDNKDSASAAGNFRESKRRCAQVLNYLTKDVKHEETKTESTVKC